MLSFLSLVVVARKIGNAGSVVESGPESVQAPVHIHGSRSFTGECNHPPFGDVDVNKDGKIDPREFYGVFDKSSSEIYAQLRKHVDWNKAVYEAAGMIAAYNVLKANTGIATLTSEQRHEMCEGRVITPEQAGDASHALSLAVGVSDEGFDDVVAWWTKFTSNKAGLVEAGSQKWWGRHCGPKWGPTGSLTYKLCLKKGLTCGECQDFYATHMSARDPLDTICLQHDIKVTYSNAGCCDQFNYMHYSAGEVIDEFQKNHCSDAKKYGYCRVGWSEYVWGGWSRGWVCPKADWVEPIGVPPACSVSYYADAFFYVGEGPANYAFTLFGNADGPGKTDNCPKLTWREFDKDQERGCYDDGWVKHDWHCNSETGENLIPMDRRTTQTISKNDNTCMKNFARVDLTHEECTDYANTKTKHALINAAWVGFSETCYEDSDKKVYWNTPPGSATSLSEAGVPEGLSLVCGGNSFCQMTRGAGHKVEGQDWKHMSHGYWGGDGRKEALAEDVWQWEKITYSIYGFSKTDWRKWGDGVMRHGYDDKEVGREGVLDNLFFGDELEESYVAKTSANTRKGILKSLGMTDAP